MSHHTTHRGQNNPPAPSETKPRRVWATRFERFNRGQFTLQSSISLLVRPMYKMNIIIYSIQAKSAPKNRAGKKWVATSHSVGWMIRLIKRFFNSFETPRAQKAQIRFYERRAEIQMQAVRTIPFLTCLRSMSQSNSHFFFLSFFCCFCFSTII